MKFIIRLIVIILFVFLYHIAYSKEKIKVAVLEFKPVNVPAYYAGIAKAHVEELLVDKGDFVVIERSHVEIIFQEMQLKKKTCEETSCLVDAGRALSADVILTGTVESIGGENRITIKIINVYNSKIISVDSYYFKDDKEIKKVAKKTAVSATKNIMRYEITGKSIERRYEFYAAACFSYLLPYKGLAYVVNNGYGFNLNFGLKDNHLMFGLEAGFYSLNGKRYLDSGKYFPLLLGGGYELHPFDFFSITPFISGGINMAAYSNKNYYFGLQQGMKRFCMYPIIKAQINCDFSINPFLKVQTSVCNSIMFQGNSYFLFVDFKIGTGVVF